jgi:2,4-dienoyl-CoA reductase-like NADH-dependent reductase (Old Yellow Enzyme family)
VTRSIFEPTEINGLALANRLVRSATWEGLGAPDGGVTEELVEVYRELADGGVGLIITGYTAVRADGRQSTTQLLADRDEKIPGLARIADTVHERGGKVVAQIVHCGGQATREASGCRPAAPSAVASPGYPEVPRELDSDDIDNLVASFAGAARRIREAGYDGVQLHGAHGYLMAQFLSPARNLRRDRWGGDVERRSRFTRRVYRAVRAEVGPDWPVMIKLNANDFLPGSTTEDDACHLAAALAGAGIDAIEVSGGTSEVGRIAFDAVSKDAEGRLFSDRFGTSSVPIGIQIVDDEKRACVAHANADDISIVDLEQWKVIGTLSAGKEPDGMGFSPQSPAPKADDVSDD